MHTLYLLGVKPSVFSNCIIQIFYIFFLIFIVLVTSFWGGIKFSPVIVDLCISSHSSMSYCFINIHNYTSLLYYSFWSICNITLCALNATKILRLWFQLSLASYSVYISPLIFFLVFLYILVWNMSKTRYWWILFSLINVGVSFQIGKFNPLGIFYY